MFSFTVYDRHAACPAWAVTGECDKSNSSWMMDNCPGSCNVNGGYQRFFNPSSLAGLIINK